MNRLQEDIADLMADSTGGRAGLTRRPLQRIYEIHAAINSGSYPNCTKLARMLSVQRKTIQQRLRGARCA